MSADVKCTTPAQLEPGDRVVVQRGSAEDRPNPGRLPTPQEALTYLRQTAGVSPDDVHVRVIQRVLDGACVHGNVAMTCTKCVEDAGVNWDRGMP